MLWKVEWGGGSAKPVRQDMGMNAKEMRVVVGEGENKKAGEGTKALIETEIDLEKSTRASEYRVGSRESREHPLTGAMVRVTKFGGIGEILAIVLLIHMEAIVEPLRSNEIWRRI